jgi:hypothetical protein
MQNPISQCNCPNDTDRQRWNQQLNTLVDAAAVFAADRLLQSGTARAARARLLNRMSGVTMLGLGAYRPLSCTQAVNP